MLMTLVRVSSEGERLQGGQGLRPDQHLPPIQPIDQHPGKRCQQESGNLSCKTYQSQKQRRTRKAINEPTGGDASHPGANQRNALTGKEQSEITVP